LLAGVCNDNENTRLHLSLYLSVIVCNAAGERPPDRVGGRAADNARRASTVTSRMGETLFTLLKYTLFTRYHDSVVMTDGWLAPLNI